MNQIYVDIIQSMSGVVTILAGFLSAFFYLRKRTQDWKVIITASLAIAILIGAGFYGFGGPQVVKDVVVNIGPTPKHTLNDYCKYLITGDYDMAYDKSLSMNSPLKKMQNRTYVIKSYTDQFKEVNGVNKCIINDDFKENGDSTKGTVTIVFGNGQIHNEETILEKDGNEWKIIA